MKLLLQSGANVNLGDDGNNTPLHCACVRGNETAAKLLLEVIYIYVYVCVCAHFLI